MPTCIHKYVHTYMLTNTHACVHTDICMRTSILAFVHTLYTYLPVLTTHIHAYIPSYIYIHRHTYPDTCIHRTYIYMYIHIGHTYMHTYTCLRTYVLHMYLLSIIFLYTCRSTRKMVRLRLRCNHYAITPKRHLPYKFSLVKPRNGQTNNCLQQRLSSQAFSTSFHP